MSLANTFADRNGSLIWNYFVYN